MLKVDPNQKLQRQHFVEKTGKQVKQLRMKDIHNISRDMKQKTNTIPSVSVRSRPVGGGTEDNTVRGLYFQDQEMRTAFERFPEVILMDATHKTNS